MVTHLDTLNSHTILCDIICHIRVIQLTYRNGMIFVKIALPVQGSTLHPLQWQCLAFSVGGLMGSLCMASCTQCLGGCGRNNKVLDKRRSHTGMIKSINRNLAGDFSPDTGILSIHQGILNVNSPFFKSRIWKWIENASILLTRLKNILTYWTFASCCVTWPVT